MSRIALLSALAAAAFVACSEQVPDASVAPAPAPAAVRTRGAPKSDCVAFAAPPERLTLEPVMPIGLVAPLSMVAHAPTGSYYVAERGGRLVRVVGGVWNEAVHLGTSAGLIIRDDPEDGFLGFEPHPKFPAVPYGYFKYTAKGGPTGMRVVVARMTSGDGGVTFDPGSLAEVLAYPAEESHHHGGAARFGPDGMLYVAFGDGGMDYKGDRAQDLGDIRGKMLRIDVDGAAPYAVPKDNPFVAKAGARPEIWALGFRNPFEWSFDERGTLWLGDVGHGEIEEIDHVVRGGNYGWRIREGTRCMGAAPCGSSALIDPYYEYSHNEGFAVVGGRIYRGKALPWLAGRYVFGDYVTGQIWALTTDPTTQRVVAELLASSPTEITQFVEDFDGELLAMSPRYGPMKLIPNTAKPAEPPRLLSRTGCVDMSSPTLPARGLAPYDVAMPLWSDGTGKARFLALPEGKTIQLRAEGPKAIEFELPSGAVVVKSFFLGGKPIETRLLVNHEVEGWRGYTYEWNDSATEAVLLGDLKKKRIGDLDWHYPSRAQCNACHTAAAGRVLGIAVAQLNGQMLFPDGHMENQIEALDRAGLLAATPAPVHMLPRFVAREGEASSDGEWARAYLHANCAHCHIPGGPGGGRGNLHAATPLVGNLCAFEGKLDGETMRWVEPGKPERSLIVRRMDRSDGARMPPLGTAVRDEVAIARMRAWIAGLESCDDAL